MTIVRVRLIPPGASDPVPGTMFWTARHTEAGRVIAEGPDIVLSAPQRFEISAGITLLELRPSSAGWFYEVRGVTEDGHTFQTCVLVPPRGEHDFEDLERIDPKAGLAYAPKPVWQADLDSIRGLGGIPGQEGASAYEVAVRQGFTGTLDEWLQQLRGPQGEPGPRGPGPDMARLEAVENTAGAADDLAREAASGATAAYNRANEAHQAAGGAKQRADAAHTASSDNAQGLTALGGRVSSAEQEISGARDQLELHGTTLETSLLGPVTWFDMSDVSSLDGSGAASWIIQVPSYVPANVARSLRFEVDVVTDGLTSFDRFWCRPQWSSNGQTVSIPISSSGDTHRYRQRMDFNLPAGESLVVRLAVLGGTLASKGGRIGVTRPVFTTPIERSA